MRLLAFLPVVVVVALPKLSSSFLPASVPALETLLVTASPMLSAAASILGVPAAADGGRPHPGARPTSDSACTCPPSHPQPPHPHQHRFSPPIPARRFTAGLTSNSSRPCWHRCPLIRGRNLASSHHRAGVPQLPSRTLPVRCGVALPLNRGAQHRPQVHHQLVHLEPQRRLLIPWPATVGSAAPYDSGLVRRRRCEAGLGAGLLGAEYVDIRRPNFPLTLSSRFPFTVWYSVPRIGTDDSSVLIYSARFCAASSSGHCSMPAPQTMPGLLDLTPLGDARVNQHGRGNVTVYPADHVVRVVVLGYRDKAGDLWYRSPDRLLRRFALLLLVRAGCRRCRRDRLCGSGVTGVVRSTGDSARRHQLRSRLVLSRSSLTCSTRIVADVSHGGQFVIGCSANSRFPTNLRSDARSHLVREGTAALSRNEGGGRPQSTAKSSATGQ